MIAIIVPEPPIDPPEATRLQLLRDARQEWDTAMQYAQNAWDLVDLAGCDPTAVLIDAMSAIEDAKQPIESLVMNAERQEPAE